MNCGRQRHDELVWVGVTATEAKFSGATRPVSLSLDFDEVARGHA